jgi:RNA polymerase sigma-70 factor (ECF subfamily)
MASRRGQEFETGVQDAFAFGTATDQETAEASLLDRLAASAASGDKQAFEAIYAATVDEIYGYLSGRLRDEQTAEDLASNIYLKAWTAARSYHAGSHKYRRWLFAIAHNELRDHWRRSKPQVALSDAMTARLAEPAADSDPEGRAEAVLSAMDRLNEQQQRIVALRFFSGLNHAEIARIVGKREGAVRAQLLRALRQMRKVMAHAAT